MKNKVNILILIILIPTFFFGCSINRTTGLRSIPFTNIQTGYLKSEEGKEFKVNYYPTISKAPAILLIPGDVSENYFGSLPSMLNKAGINVLVIDKYYNWPYFSNQRLPKWKLLAKRGGVYGLAKNEVLTSLNFLKKQDNVDFNRIGILGSSMGSALCLTALKINQEITIKGFAAISPGRICTSGYMIKLRSLPTKNWKVFLASSSGDINPGGQSAADCSDMISYFFPEDNVTNKKYSGKLHGTKLIKNNFSVSKEITDWAVNSL